MKPSKDSMPNSRQRFEDLLSGVAQVVASVADREITNSEENLTAYGLDSMAMLDVLAALEERYEIILNESVIEEFYSISRIARVVQDAVRSSQNV